MINHNQIVTNPRPWLAPPPPEKKVDFWLEALRGKAVLWLGGGFVEPARVAFRALSSINTEPYLYLVPGEMSVHAGLLRRLGVKEAFGPGDLVGMMRELHAGQAGRALSAAKVEVSVGILQLLARQLEGKGDSGDSQGERKRAGGADSGGGGGGSTDSSPSGAAAVELLVPPAYPPTKPPKPTPATPAPLSLAQLGQIFVPDSTGVLTLVTACSYDDAPWISALLVQKGSNIKFTHPALGPDALVLGALSLRVQLFAGDEMVCPDAAKLAGAVQLDGVFEALCDVLALADALGAHSMHVIYDPRTHAKESLMHPGLAAAQVGPIPACLHAPRP